ncbi:YqiA/YcfP family alpha/beta fold hydrolase [Azotobacter armeniacus]
MPSAAPSLLYIHGFNSSSASYKAQQLINAMQALDLATQLRVPDLHHHPRPAIVQLEAALAELGRPTLVGSSLGGYYATHLAERHGLPVVLINPAVRPHRLFDGRLGPQRNYYSGETWELTADHLAALAALEVPPPQDPARYRVWLQTGDETLDWRDAATYYRHCIPCVETGGDHSFQGFARRLPELLAFAGFDAGRWRDFNFSEL